MFFSGVCISGCVERRAEEEYECQFIYQNELFLVKQITTVDDIPQNPLFSNENEANSQPEEEVNQSDEVPPSPPKDAADQPEPLLKTLSEGIDDHETSRAVQQEKEEAVAAEKEGAAENVATDGDLAKPDEEKVIIIYI